MHSGFKRLKHDLLTDKEWERFRQIANSLTDNQLRFLCNAANRPETAVQENEELPHFTTKDECEALYLACKHSLPSWLQPEVEQTWRKLSSSSEGRSLFDTHLRRLRGMLSVDWNDNKPIEINYQQAFDYLISRHPGLEYAIEQTLEKVMLVNRSRDTGPRPFAFIGPPGTGKSSLIEDFAIVLNRPCVSIAMASMVCPEAMVGTPSHFDNSAFGCIMDACIHNRTTSLLLYIDEFDEAYRKIDHDSAKCGSTLVDLFEKATFADEFLGLTAHLNSPLIFVTINDPSVIPEKLLQRFFTIEILPYRRTSKKRILTEAIWPKYQKTYGFEATQLLNEAAEEIINRSRPEAGMRSVIMNVESLVARLARQSAMPDSVTREMVKGILPFPYREQSHVNAVGKAKMLGVSASGCGLSSDVVVILENDDRSVVNIMGLPQGSARESVDTALLVARRTTNNMGDTRSISIQVGSATPKDGPSAGVTIAAAIASAYLKKPLRADVALTGELWIDGHITAIGGVHAKVLAAEEAHCTALILPEENLHEVPTDTSLQIIPVRTIKQVYDFLDLNPILKEV